MNCCVQLCDKDLIFLLILTTCWRHEFLLWMKVSLLYTRYFSQIYENEKQRLSGCRSVRKTSIFKCCPLGGAQMAARRLEHRTYSKVKGNKQNEGVIYQVWKQKSNFDLNQVGVLFNTTVAITNKIVIFCICTQLIWTARNSLCRSETFTLTLLTYVLIGGNQLFRR